MNKYVVQLTLDVSGIPFKALIKHIFSYKKGMDGMTFCFDNEIAHKYSSEKTALIPAQKYNGKIIII